MTANPKINWSVPSTFVPLESHLGQPSLYSSDPLMPPNTWSLSAADFLNSWHFNPNAALSQLFYLLKMSGCRNTTWLGCNWSLRCSQLYWSQVVLSWFSSTDTALVGRRKVAWWSGGLTGREGGSWLTSQKTRSTLNFLTFSKWNTPWSKLRIMVGV